MRMMKLWSIHYEYIIFQPISVNQETIKALTFITCRMCKALLPGDDDSMSDEAIWETLPVSFSQLSD